jgi:CheY-like chemotaxis protein
MGAGGEGNAAAAVRVLVVDDSPVDRKVVELLLRNHNKGGAAPFHGQPPCLLFLPLPRPFRRFSLCSRRPCGFSLRRFDRVGRHVVGG